MCAHARESSNGNFDFRKIPDTRVRENLRNKCSVGLAIILVNFKIKVSKNYFRREVQCFLEYIEKVLKMH